MYRENSAPPLGPDTPTWRERAQASFDRYSRLWMTLGLVWVLLVLLLIGPPACGPDAPVWSVLIGIVSFGALVVGSLVGCAAVIVVAFDTLRHRLRFKAWPEDADMAATICGWVLMVWITTIIYACELAVFDQRVGKSHDPLHLYTTDRCRVLSTGAGRVCIPPDTRLVWCLPVDRTKRVPWRIYTNACRE